MLVEFTKSERKQLRELATSVYEAEAHDLLQNSTPNSAVRATASTRVLSFLVLFMSSTSSNRATFGQSIKASPMQWRLNAAFLWSDCRIHHPRGTSCEAAPKILRHWPSIEAITPRRSLR